MSTSAKNDLVTALKTMVLISEEQSRDLMQAREETSRLKEIFEQKLNERMEGQLSPNLLPADILSSKASKFRDQHHRQQRREASFLDAFHALMHLYGDAATRPKAERVFGLLREIRMIDLGDDPGKFASEMPSLSPSPEGESPEERRRGLLGSFLGHGGMSEWMEKRQEAMNKLIERSDALLREALEVAETDL